MTGVGPDRDPRHGFASRLAGIRSDFLVAFHEREDLLRHELVGDVDIAAVKADRAARSASGARHPSAGGRGVPVDPDDDGDLPYSFF
ncbi:hypothetical protein GALL_408420 [mine drainage metagenome]|uniref:Uncharacterized protein n=1 Tax=mine drainage metagenome TaxID=410659 RepID=A0A1J5Q2C8_9ZZZZ